MECTATATTKLSTQVNSVHRDRHGYHTYTNRLPVQQAANPSLWLTKTRSHAQTPTEQKQQKPNEQKLADAQNQTLTCDASPRPPRLSNSPSEESLSKRPPRGLFLACLQITHGQFGRCLETPVFSASFEPTLPGGLPRPLLGPGSCDCSSGSAVSVGASWGRVRRGGDWMPGAKRTRRARCGLAPGSPSEQIHEKLLSITLFSF
jgi:hypothetical protein